MPSITAKALIGVFFAWFWITVVSMLLEGQYIADADVLTKLEVITGFQIIEMRDIGWFSLPIPNFSYFTTIIDIIRWDFPMYTGEWGQLFKMGVLVPVSAGAVVSVAFALFSFIRR